MSSLQWHKGAHFYRSDFQVHTPRDLRWTGGDAVTDEERKEFGQKLISACRTKKLDAIAITDHHDFAVFPYVKLASAEELDDDGNPIPPERRIVVFPGLELTLGVPCQAIAIFDANIPVEHLKSALTVLSITPSPDSESKTAQVLRLDNITSFQELYKLFNGQESLKGKFIVLPNVSEGGSSTVLRSGFAPHYKAMPCVGGYLDGSVNQFGTGNQQIISGKNKDYGFKALGVFQTSDNRKYDFSDLGTHSSWVKWAEPTAEALRQACLARESRIAHAEPDLPNIWITDLHVSNSKFMGPIDLYFSDQFTSLIGGRGTGKSTLLEYLRWCLCDQPPKAVAEDVELPDFQKRRSSLIEKTLGELGATVEVGFIINSVQHKVRRNTKGEVLLKIADNPFRASSEEEIRSMFPIHAYSQKQLSNVGVRIEELNRFIEQPIKKQLSEIDENISRLSSDIRRTYESKTSVDQANVEKALLETEEVSVRAQIKTLRETEKALTVEDQEILKAQVEFENDNAQIEIWKTELASIATQYSTFSKYIENIPSSPVETSSSFIKQQYGVLGELVTAVKEGLEASEKLFSGEIREKYQKQLDDWADKKAKNKQTYKEIQGRLHLNSATVAQITSLEERLRKIQLLLAEKNAAIKKNDLESKQYAEFLTNYMDLISSRNSLLREQCVRLTALSKGFIKAELVEGASPNGAQAALREIVKGTKIRNDKIDTLFGAIISSNSALNKWHEILQDLEALSKFDGQDGKNTKLPVTPILDAIELTEAEKLRLATKLTKQMWTDLLLTPLGSTPVFKYQSREAEYFDFTDASAGQQATALMHVLLNQSGPPLVIDQPEDDLDSNIIESICAEIWQAKSRRQIIFTSHNANLVVNGDSDLVVSCDYRIAGDQSGGKIAQQGAIDVETVRKEITRIMEGGEKAFYLRRQKYGF